MEFKLILKKLNNSLTKEEELIFLKWYQEDEAHKNYFDNVKANYDLDPSHIDVEKGWHLIEEKINEPFKKKFYWKYAVAASIVLLISLPFMFNSNKESQKNIPTIVNNNIKIGTDKATLTLEDGSQISLEKGKQYIADNLESTGKDLVYSLPKQIKNEITYNCLTIPRGGQYHIVLSDKTEVWLNSESQLKYPVSFIQGKPREVELLYGEAYFEVSPSTKHQGSKFKVFTNIQEIEVLGTAFNVKAYQDEDIIYTTLIEGKVSLNTENDHEILNPNEQLILNKLNKNRVISKIDVSPEIAWRKGLFVFKSKTLKDIMKVLSRWYNVSIVFEDENLETIEFKGVLNKNQNIEEILTLIKNTNFINAYEIKDNQIIIKK